MTGRPAGCPVVVGPPALGVPVPGASLRCCLLHEGHVLVSGPATCRASPGLVDGQWVSPPSRGELDDTAARQPGRLGDLLLRPACCGGLADQGVPLCPGRLSALPRGLTLGLGACKLGLCDCGHGLRVSTLSVRGVSGDTGGYEDDASSAGNGRRAASASPRSADTTLRSAGRQAAGTRGQGLARRASRQAARPAAR